MESTASTRLGELTKQKQIIVDSNTSTIRGQLIKWPKCARCKWLIQRPDAHWDMSMVGFHTKQNTGIELYCWSVHMHDFIEDGDTKHSNLAVTFASIAITHSVAGCIFYASDDHSITEQRVDRLPTVSHRRSTCVSTSVYLQIVTIIWNASSSSANVSDCTLRYIASFTTTIYRSDFFIRWKD